MTVAGVVLAAGGGSRLIGTTYKMVAPFRGRPLVSWAVDAVVVAGLDETIVVVGAHADAVRAELPTSVTVCHNANWASGVASSLQAGLSTARRRGHEAVVVGLGDQPFVSPEAWRRLAAYEECPIGVATYAGDRGHPVRIAREVWALSPDDGDEGMRNIMILRPELVGEVPCSGTGVDIDTLEDLERWS